MFFGVIVAIFYEDTGRHNTPHIHVRRQGKKASISIEDGTIKKALGAYGYTA
jgi:hypothetical protein